MLSLKQWFIKNKVLIFGFITTALLTINELKKGGEGSVKVYVICGLIAAMTWLGRNLRGQVATIVIILANGAAAWYSAYKTGTVDYGQLIIQIALSYLGLSASPMKSVGYEQSEMIKVAKAEGEVIQPSMMSNPSDPNKKPDQSGI